KTWARKGWEQWLSWAVRSRLEPIKKVAKTIKEHLWGILNAQACLRPRDRFWDIPVPKIDSAFDNLLVPQTSWSPSTTQQLRKLVAAPYLAPI
ncbi:transposase, partial [Thiolapillus sp.]|uniref:transposase n=1 Tax=Thiolapillus sp. TaxID=2017437 RepID=UPI003AF9EF30